MHCKSNLIWKNPSYFPTSEILWKINGPFGLRQLKMSGMVEKTYMYLANQCIKSNENTE
jgi:hypothetical protein